MSARVRGPIRILSIDGGGIRGYIPALVLADLERRRLERSEKSHLASRFDLLAGTSTGALIALALAAPREAAAPLPPGPSAFASLLGRPSADAPRRFDCATIASFYEKRGAEFFPRSRLESLDMVRQAIGAKYDPKPLERFLAESFGDLKLSDAANAVLATAYDAERGEALVMKNLGDGPDFLLRDAARASSAAPSFFPAARIREIPVRGTDGKAATKSASIMLAPERVLLDGGLFANNPALCAFVEARRRFPGARRFQIVSLGTGSNAPKWDVDRIGRWGYLDWIDPSKGSPLFAMMSLAQSGSVDWMLSHMPGVDYIRLEPALGPDGAAIDDTSPSNLERLRKAARDLITTNEAVLENLASRL